MLRYPGLDVDGGPAQPAPRPSRVLEAGGPDGAARGDRPRQIIADAFAMAATPATGPIPPASALFDPTADPAVPYDLAAARTALKAAGWKQADDWLAPARGEGAARHRAAEPRQASNPAAFAAAVGVARDWTRARPDGHHAPCHPAQFVTGRLASGDFSAAVGDVTVGLDPDLYPLLASSQTLTGGSTSSACRIRRSTSCSWRPAARARCRSARPPTRPSRSSSRRVATCSRWRSRTRSIVVRDTVIGPAMRQVADPADRFWDVLTWRLAAGR